MIMDKEKEIFDIKRLNKISGDEYGNYVIGVDDKQSKYKIGDIINYQNQNYRIYAGYSIPEADDKDEMFTRDFYYKFYPFDLDAHMTIDNYTGIRHYENNIKNYVTILFSANNSYFE